MGPVLGDSPGHGPRFAQALLLRQAFDVQRILAGVLLAFTLAVVLYIRLVPLQLHDVSEDARVAVRAEIIAELHATSAAESILNQAENRSVDSWISAHAAAYEGRVATHAARIRDSYRCELPDGTSHQYLGDYDSYFWMRRARNLVESGSQCDDHDGGGCRDALAHAPLGREMTSARSLHPRMIATVHRALSVFANVALPTSAYLSIVFLSVAGTVIAFALGFKVGGLLGASLIASLTSTELSYFHRSIGADNDAWNIILPLLALTMLLYAVAARQRTSRIVSLTVACVAIAAQASLWSGWRFTYITFSVGLMSLCLLSLLRWHSGGAKAKREMLQIAGLTSAFIVCSGFGAWLVGVGESPHGLVDDSMRAVRNWLGIETQGISAMRTRANELPWPSAFPLVKELSGAGYARQFRLGSDLWYAQFAWMFFPLLCLSAHATRRDAAILVAACLALAFVWTMDASLMAVAAVGTVVLSCTLLFCVRGPLWDHRGAVLLVLLWPWVLGAAVLASGAPRFSMLVGAPLAIAFGAQCGIVYSWLTARFDAGPVVATLLGVICAMVALPSVHAAVVSAHAYRPEMNDAWAETFTSIADETPRDTIVTTWWDYGYWAAYYARRRTTMDGGSLRTAIPYWVARSLARDDVGESVGILRMLACGSAASEFPEGQLSALSRLRTAGSSATAAMGRLQAILRLDRSAASEWLRGRGVAASAIADVLERTHCDPPPMVVVLSEKMAGASPWVFGSWDFSRAYAAQAASNGVARAQIEATLATDFDEDLATAATIFADLEKLGAAPDPAAFAVRSEGYFTREWQNCERVASEVSCPLDILVQGGRDGFEAFVMHPSLPATGRLVYRGTRRDRRSFTARQTVGTVLIAGAAGLRALHFRNADHPQLGVLFDERHSRVLVGTPRVLGSLFTHLNYLDGRYLTSEFSKLSERESVGERVTAWALLWPQADLDRAAVR